MSILLSLGSPLLLAMATALCLLPRLRERLRWNLALPALVAASIAIAFAQLAWLWDGSPTSLRLTLSPWTPRLFEFGPGLDVDRLAALCLLLVGLSTAIGLLRGLRLGVGPEACAGPLSIAAASAFFCVAARSPLGLVAAWLLLDVTLLFGGRVRRRGLLAGQLGLILVLAGLMGPVDARLIPSSELASSVRFWLLAAAGVRMGAYPLSWAVPRSRSDQAWAASLSRIGPLLAGASLAVQMASSGSPGPGIDIIPLLPGIVALLFGGLLAWLTIDRPTSLDWASTASGGLILIAAGIGGAVGIGAAVLILVDASLGRSLLYAFEDGRGTLARLGGGLALLGLAGLPPSLALLGRAQLYGALIDAGLEFVLFGIALATVGVAVPVGRRRVQPLQVGTDRIVEATLLAVALIPSLLGLGLGFGLVEIPWLNHLRAEDLASSSPFLLSLLLLPPLIGFALQRTPWVKQRADRDSRRLRLGEVLRLTELFDGLRTALIEAGRVIHRSLGLVEGHRTMALTLLAAVAVGLTLMAGSGVVPSGEISSTTLELTLWLAAISIASLHLVVTQRLVSLGALLAGYVLVSVILMVSTEGATPAALAMSALVKPLTGIVVVAILAISILQSSEDEETEAAPLLESEPSDRSEVWLRLISFGIAVIIIGSIRSSALPDALPEMVLRPALTLIAGGVLTAIFARSALRLAVAVLVALVGFEFVYARLDPGLFVTGGLAAFHILFAILTSLFVGMALDPEQG